MSDLMADVIYYLEFAAGMAVWILLSCVIVAGLERVVFKIIPRKSPNEIVVPAPSAATTGLPEVR